MRQWWIYSIAIALMFGTYSCIFPEDYPQHHKPEHPYGPPHVKPHYEEVKPPYEPPHVKPHYKEVKPLYEPPHGKPHYEEVKPPVKVQPKPRPEVIKPPLKVKPKPKLKKEEMQPSNIEPKKEEMKIPVIRP